MGGEGAEDDVTTAAYWVRHVREAVRFADGIVTLQATEVEAFLEIGPRPVLLGLVRVQGSGERGQGDAVSGQGGERGQGVGSRGQGEHEERPEPLLLPSLRAGQSDWQSMLMSLGALYERGASIDWQGFERDYVRRRVALPTYPFQRQRYWVETTKLHSPSPSIAAATPSALLEQVVRHGTFTVEERATIARALAILTTTTRTSIEEEPDEIASLLVNVSWEQQLKPEPTAAHTGRWLILSDSGGVGSHLAKSLTTRGAAVMLVTADDHGATLTHGLTEDLEGIILLSGLDQQTITSATQLMASQKPIAEVLLAIIQMFAPRSGRQPRIWIATQGAQAVTGYDLRYPIQSPLWGLGKVVALEHGELWGGLIDLDPMADSVEQARQLLCELSSERANGEQQVAYRGGMRYVARLVRTAPTTLRHAHIDPAATYLITGGLGALGLQVATWLARQGAKRLLLTGRRGVTEVDQRNTIAQLNAYGVAVQVEVLDVTDESALRSLLEELRYSTNPLRGVFHCAGVLDDGILLNQSWERFAPVLAPKVAGAWLLHELTQDLPLELMVFFSSVTALLGNAGQGNYAAANAFLDGLACYRQQLGLPGVSINWGPWAGQGMFARTTTTSRARFQAMSAQRALHALAQLLPMGGQVGVVAADWSGVAGSEPFFDRLAPTAFAIKGVHTSIAELAKRTPPQHGQGLVVELQVMVAQILGITDPLQVSPEQPLIAMGLDSLMAIELRKAVIQRLALQVPPSRFLDGGTLLTLAASLTKEFESNTSPLSGRLLEGEVSRTTPTPIAVSEAKHEPHLPGDTAYSRLEGEL